jgi:hypothetical protein
MSKDFDHLLDDLAARAIMRRFKPDDYLVLSDDTLRAALDGTQPLDETEWKALLASPLTLRRMRTLEQQRLWAQRRTPRATTAAEARRVDAANDGEWLGSWAELRAAADGGSTHALRTDDGYWSLEFLRAPDGLRAVLKLDADAPFAKRLLTEKPRLAVLDGQGAEVFGGELDSYGEVEALWPHADQPYPYFAKRGTGIRVVPAK